MPVNTYEAMFLLDSSKVAVSWDDSVKHVHDILTKHESEIVASRQWDERRLSYPVDGHKKGTYLLTYFKSEGANLKDIVADCRLSDLVLRELILKGSSQAGRPPGQPGDDLDAQRRRGSAREEDMGDPAPPSSPRRLSGTISRGPGTRPTGSDRSRRVGPNWLVPDPSGDEPNRPSLILVGGTGMW